MKMRNHLLSSKMLFSVLLTNAKHDMAVYVGKTIVCACQLCEFNLTASIIGAVNTCGREKIYCTYL